MLFGPPRTVTLVNSRDSRVICERCIVADSFWRRGRGLLGRSHLAPEEGILLLPGSSIHMFGMKFAIDVVFVTREDVITDMVENIAPGKAYVAKGQSGKPFGALELAAGAVTRLGLQVGDKILRQEQAS